MLIDRFFSKGREFLGSQNPIMCGAMTWVSDPSLVSAMGNAGGFGLLAGATPRWISLQARSMRPEG